MDTTYRLIVSKATIQRANAPRVGSPSANRAFDNRPVLPTALCQLWLDAVSSLTMSRVLTEYMASKPALRRYLSRFFRRRQDVEDMLQEVFVRAFAAEARGPILMPRAYLFRVAKHAALNELARRKNAATDSVEDFADPDVVGSGNQPGVEQEVDSRRRLALFANAVAALPMQCRKVLVLKKVEGLSQREVAARLGIAESTVEKHLAKALLLTRDFMAHRDPSFASDASLAESSDVRRLRRGEAE